MGLDGVIRSLEAATAVAPYQIVAFYAPRASTLIAPATNGKLPLVGTSGKLGGSGGDLVDITISGAGQVRLGAGVNGGDPLTSDALGRALLAKDGDYIIGYAGESGPAGAVISYRASPRNGVTYTASPLTFDSTGRASSNRGTVIYEHDFSDMVNRQDGWTHLWTPGELSNCGSTQHISRGGQGRLAVIADTQVGGLALALRRLSTVFGDGRHLVEFIVSIERMNYNHAYPRYYVMGLDVANEAGTLRNFFQARYLQYNEAGGAVAEKWQLDFGTAGMIDVPGGAIPFMENENKALPVRVILDIDTGTGRYHGIQVGEALKLGSLAVVPDTTIYDLGARPVEQLLSFARGANLCVGVANRTTGTKTKGQINVHFCRLTKLEG